MSTQESRNLRSILDDEPLRMARAIQIVRDIARELAHTHLQGEVHGGIRPSNILVLRSGAVKIIDFDTGQAAPLSPEQARGDAIDHRCDIFALGALFYEMLAHRAPFAGSTPKEIAHNILHVEPARPSELNRHVPPALDAIVMSMLAKQPVDRMPGIPVLRRELECLEEELGLGPAAPAADEAAAGVPPGRREPTLRMPDPSEFRDPGEPAMRPGSSTKEALEHRKRIIEREVSEHRRAAAEPAPWPPRSSRMETIVAVGVVLLVLGLGVGGFMYFTSSPNVRAVAKSRVQEAPVASAPTAPLPVAEVKKEPVVNVSKEPVAAVGAWQKSPPPVAEPPKAPAAPPRAVVRPTAPPPVAEAIKEPAIAPAAPQALPTSAMSDQETKAPAGSGLTVPPSMVEAKKSVRASSEGEVKQPAAAPAREAPRTKQATAKAPEPQQPRGKAQLILAVSPGGEIYIDDKYLGDTPPMTTFDLDPGMYRIEVRSASHKPFLTYMTVEPGDVRRIRHDFDAKPSRPPGG